jgi:hypothetical protein
LLVTANSAAEAEKQAIDGITDRNISASAYAYEIKSLQDLPFNMDKYSTPLNSDKTVQEILKIAKN